eukprot:scaffold439153_cov37-Prasinocladus_malaysianus.AAC.1
MFALSTLTVEEKATENRRITMDTVDSTSCAQKLIHPSRLQFAAALRRFDFAVSPSSELGCHA